jgi:F0F1-type ATP synthase assembly protein I
MFIHKSYPQKEEYNMQKKLQKRYLLSVIGLAIAFAALLASFQFQGFLKNFYGILSLLLFLLSAIYLAYVTFNKQPNPKG